MRGDAVDKIVEQWARERPDLDTEPMAILGRLYRAADLAHETMARTITRHGISAGDYDVLATLRRSGEPFELSPGELSRSLMLTSGGMTRRLDRLERAGLISRGRSSDDRRSLQVALTESGRELIDRALEDGVRTQQELVEGLSPAERRQLNALLRGLVSAPRGGSRGT